ncbi:SirB2 family protein [Pseudomaricurvus sp. HS19]|uniref:SirB2 family protein n=1 Tax=Pseudomaricurvus sp. HS19 TaxID=2692626 RepID=UPI00136B87AA|nr:SirB2 family protein [Pseudomaricurvus sp. HS19]MYM62770.1 siroheme synthase [Pseudomaricurvus sp. HS19]
MTYLTLKTVHQLLVAMSVSFWMLRLHWQRRNTLQTKGAWPRRLAPMIDTLLLGSGLWLIHLTNFTPFNSHWLTAKLVLLICYILLGAMALNYGRPRHRVAYCSAGIICVLLMILLARFKPAL